MESANNNNQLFLSEFKELRKELSAVKKRIVQLEESHEKQQERIEVLERENHTRWISIEEEEIELKPPASVSTGKKKTKTDNNNDDDDDEAVVLLQCDNGDSFDSLSDDLLHKIVEFDGNCYSKFASINKRCKNIYDVKEYKLKKQTCVYGYGTVDMMLQHYLKQRRGEGLFLGSNTRWYIAQAVIIYNRFDAIEWIIQLEDKELLKWVYCIAARYGKINILTKLFRNSNLTILETYLDNIGLCYQAAYDGQLESLKLLRKYGAKWNAEVFDLARDNGYDEVVQYLRKKGCPETFVDLRESSESEQVGSEDEEEDSDY